MLKKPFYSKHLAVIIFYGDYEEIEKFLSCLNARFWFPINKSEKNATTGVPCRHLDWALVRKKFRTFLAPAFRR